MDIGKMPLGKIGSKMPSISEMNERLSKETQEIRIPTEPIGVIGDFLSKPCTYCFGTGKLKQGELARSLHSSEIHRYVKLVDCDKCNGCGRV